MRYEIKEIVCMEMNRIRNTNKLAVCDMICDKDLIAIFPTSTESVAGTLCILL